MAYDASTRPATLRRKPVRSRRSTTKRAPGEDRHEVYGIGPLLAKPGEACRAGGDDGAATESLVLGDSVPCDRARGAWKRERQETAAAGASDPGAAPVELAGRRAERLFEDAPRLFFETETARHATRVVVANLLGSVRDLR